MPDPDLSRYARIAKFDTTLVENMTLLSSMDNYYKWVAGTVGAWTGKRILDAGCANGNLTQFFLDKELITGVDFSEDYLNQIKQRFKGNKNFISGRVDLTNAKEVSALKKYKFDTVMTMNTLEHIKDDELAFRNIYNLLDKGGKFIIFVPALMWLYSILDYEGGHFRRYTKEEVTSKLKRAGFKVEHVSYINMAGALGWYVNHVLFKKRIYSPLSFSIYNKMVPFFRFIEENIIPAQFGLSVIAVGSKQ